MTDSTTVTETVLIGQITDTHVIDPSDDRPTHVDNNQQLRDVVASMLDESPAPHAVLATGDLTDRADPVSYEILVDILSPLADRVLPLPGNHDERDGVRAAFPDAPWTDADHLCWSTTVEHVRIVGLDTLRPGHHGAQCDEGRATWLADTLASQHDGPTILAMHHPPFESGIAPMDRYGFVGLELLHEAVSSSPPDLIVCGHLHRPAVSTFAGVTARIAPSTVQHVALDLAPAHDARPLAVIRDPIGYDLHRVSTDSAGRGSIVSHIRYVGTGARPVVATD